VADRAPPPVVEAPPAPPPPPKPAVRRGIVPIEREDPVYPKDAIKRQISKGRVVARLNIDEKGNVTDINIIVSDPPRVFDRSVREALEKWKFKRGRRKVRRRGRGELHLERRISMRKRARSAGAQITQVTKAKRPPAGGLFSSRRDVSSCRRLTRGGV
jgi:TonB family protein